MMKKICCICICLLVMMTSICAYCSEIDDNDIVVDWPYGCVARLASPDIECTVDLYLSSWAKGEEMLFSASVYGVCVGDYATMYLRDGTEQLIICTDIIEAEIVERRFWVDGNDIGNAADYMIFMVGDEYMYAYIWLWEIVEASPEAVFILSPEAGDVDEL